MKKAKVFWIALLIVVLTLVSTVSAFGRGNDPELTTPPAYPDTDFNDGKWNIGKTILSSPFAYNGDQDVKITGMSYPDPGKGQSVFFYIFVGGAPTKACFPAPGGATTSVYLNHTVRNEWVKIQTKTEVHHAAKYRCAEVPANGFYALIGKK